MLITQILFKVTHIDNTIRLDLNVIHIDNTIRFYLNVTHTDNTDLI